MGIRRPKFPKHSWEEIPVKKLIRALVVLLLAVPVQGPAGKIKLGGRIEPTPSSSEVLKGHRGPFSSTGFSLEPMNDGVGAARAIKLTDGKRVRRTGLNTVEKVAIISVAAIDAVTLGLYIWIKATGC